MLVVLLKKFVLLYLFEELSECFLVGGRKDWRAFRYLVEHLAIDLKDGANLSGNEVFEAGKGEEVVNLIPSIEKPFSVRSTIWGSG